MSFFILFGIIALVCDHVLLCLLNELPVSILGLPGTVVTHASAVCSSTGTRELFESFLHSSFMFALGYESIFVVHELR